MRGGWSHRRWELGCRLRRAHGLNVALRRGRPLVAPGRTLLVAGRCLHLRHHDLRPGDALLPDDPGNARSALDVGVLGMIEKSMFPGGFVDLFVGRFLGEILAGSWLFLVARVVLPALVRQ